MTVKEDRVQQRLRAEAARPTWLTENRRKPTIKHKRDAEDWLASVGWKSNRDNLGKYWVSPDDEDKFEHGLQPAVALQLEKEALAYLEPVGWKGPTIGGHLYDPTPGTKAWKFCRVGEAVRRQKERDGVVQ